MNRRAVYFSCLKLKFSNAIVNGATDFRAAYRQAKNDAAVFAFLVPQENIATVWVRI